MKKAALKAQSPLHFRYEFSDETGRPEGGDIFQFSSTKSLQKMMSEVLAVAQSDGVTVSFTIGTGDHFFQFLKNSGLSQKEITQEMVDPAVHAVEVHAAPVKSAKKKPAQKPAKKATKKASKKKTK